MAFGESLLTNLALSIASFYICHLTLTLCCVIFLYKLVAVLYLLYMHVDFNWDFMSYTVYKLSCYIITALFVDDFDSQLVIDFASIKFVAMRFSTQIISRWLLHILFSMMIHLMVTSTITKYQWEVIVEGGNMWENAIIHDV